jgi:tetratricopeptide (TPR) repeat protein
MLAIKKWAAAFAPVVSSLLLTLLLTGCTPPGPRALLEGEALLKRGEYAKAVPKLLQATELLPQNPQAWNHLGLAYHGAGQHGEAVRAYQQALAPGRNLAVAHFNLGCLYYEQGNFSAAADELRAYTVLKPEQLTAWRLLASAQVRSRQFDAAEKSYRYLLGLEPKSVAYWNAMGVIQLHQRSRSREAQQAFNYALQQQPDYAPALFNTALASHYYFNNRPGALQKYRQYLALTPRPENWEVAENLANQLELELNPPPRPAITNAAPPAVTNQPSLTTNPPPVRPVTNSTRVETPVRSNTVAVTKPPVTPAPPQAPQPAPPQPVEVTQVPDPIPVRPAQDKPVAPKVVTPPPAAPVTPPPPVVANDTPPVATNKPGFFQKLNPANLFKRGAKSPPPTNAISVVTPAEPAPPPGKPSAVTPLPSYSKARYQYRSPARPAVGSREEAEPEFKKGLMAHQRGELPAAMTAYRKALQLDPRYFEAQHNLALAASDSGDVPGALSGYELALAILPNSNIARYNFAQALRDGGYITDAVAELEKLLKDYPAETNGHLALANLYAQQLGQRQPAREHYQKVLQLDPRHPKATDIRYWLAANP